MLQLNALHAHYGKSHVPHGVTMQVREGEIVALLGRNGSGRSTTVRTVMGLVEGSGSVTWTVHQNLQLGQQRRARAPRWGLADMYRLFPRLKERQHAPAGVLSGGEQQMLTLCRTLMGDPDLIMIDEPTEGLAPQVVELVAGYLNALRERGVAVLLVEQKLTIALRISQRCCVMGHGRIVFEGTPAALMADAYIRKEWLEV